VENRRFGRPADEPNANIGKPNRLHIARDPARHSNRRSFARLLLNDIAERNRKRRKTAPCAVSAALQLKGLIDFEEFSAPHFSALNQC